MSEYIKIYEFAASLGAFEGYVYGKQHTHELNLEALENWSANIARAHAHLEVKVRSAIQAQCHQTAGRAIRSLEPVLGREHQITQRLYNLITIDQPLPESADTFNKKKWFTHGSNTD